MNIYLSGKEYSIKKKHIDSSSFSIMLFDKKNNYIKSLFVKDAIFNGHVNRAYVDSHPAYLAILDSLKEANVVKSFNYIDTDELYSVDLDLSMVERYWLNSKLFYLHLQVDTTYGL